MSDEHVLVLNGPNLDLLGRREPGIYGTDTLADVRGRLESLAVELGCTCDVRQTNYEGQLVEWLHEAWETADGVILNPAALTHYSYAVRDAVAAIEPPVLELHISNIHARESFRTSVITAVSAGMICGLGTAGYQVALRALIDALRARAVPKGGLEPLA
jgi:3-dehydroquinate dehydratase II